MTARPGLEPLLDGGFDVVARHNAFGRGFDVLIKSGDAVVIDLQFEVLAPGVDVQPSVAAAAGGAQFLQAALDCAWDIGLRPTGVIDSKDVIAAKDKHLEDMRAIAFHGVGIAAP